MRLYLAYIPFFLISYQDFERNPEFHGKYISHELRGKQKLIIKRNGKFVNRGFYMYQPDAGGPGMPTPWFNPEKRKFKSKGNWFYFRKDTLEGIVLKSTNHIDSLYFMENGNLGSLEPAPFAYKTAIIGDTAVIKTKDLNATVFRVRYKKM